MYGCCLNPWVVIVFVVLVLVATICLMVFAVRRIGPLMKGWFVSLRKRRRRQDDEAQDSEVYLGLLDPAESRAKVKIGCHAVAISKRMANLYGAIKTTKEKRVLSVYTT
jgi:hypothetical protein